jgi:hypothetical protein
MKIVTLAGTAINHGKWQKIDASAGMSVKLKTVVCSNFELPRRVEIYAEGCESHKQPITFQGDRMRPRFGEC